MDTTTHSIMYHPTQDVSATIPPEPSRLQLKRKAEQKKVYRWLMVAAVVCLAVVAVCILAVVL